MGSGEGGSDRFEEKKTSLAFLLFSPTALLAAGLNTLASARLVNESSEHLTLCVLFFAIFVFSYQLSSCLKSDRFRTVIHELKHATLLLLTGNRVTDLQIAEDRGHVKYQVERRRNQFEPFVLLAPYFLPLFSFPLFVGLLLADGIYSNGSFSLLRVVVMAVASGVDVQMGAAEIHPHQSDLRRISGGGVMVKIFLFAAHLGWLSVVALFGIAGWEGVFQVGKVLLQLVDLW